MCQLLGDLDLTMYIMTYVYLGKEQEYIRTTFYLEYDE